MDIYPIAYDSFSTRSMATLVKTDKVIFIDPSVAIGPRRYNLPPHKIEIEELNSAKDRIIEISENYNIDVSIITHYHWDHAPRPDQKHFDILNKSKNLYIKDPISKINNSQRNRARWLLSNLKNNNIFYADGRSFELDDTYIEFTNPVWHGPKNSQVGRVIMVYIEYRNKSMLFSSDIQGVLVEETKQYIINLNPDIWTLSGPATYHSFWTEDLTEISNRNIIDILNKTSIKTVIIDHHLVRDLDYKSKIKEIYNYANDIGIKILTAAEYLGKKNRMLEANRKNLYLSEIV